MRSYNKKILEFLSQKDFNKNLKSIHEFPILKTINVLFSFLSSTDKYIKENAILSMGEIVSKIADSDFESARNIMRRLTWSLNEESGWIGWGSAEAMGEIMARNDQLAEEYHKILISYISDGENYLLFDELRKEVVFGIERLAKVRPKLVEAVGCLLD
jgi:hypothetical protein